MERTPAAGIGAAGRPDPRRPVRARPPALVLVELGAAVVVAAAGSVALQGVVSRLDTPVPSNVPAALVTATAGIVLAALAGMVLLRRSSAWGRSARETYCRV